MRVVAAGVLAGALSAGLVARAALPARSDAQESAREQPCGIASAPQLRTTLYFGLARPKGTVSELEWQMFLRDEVTARFPEGLTVWEAEGQWRRAEGGIGNERTKVLLLVHPDTLAAREAVQTVITRYRRAFEQDSVLWETARVCAAT